MNLSLKTMIKSKYKHLLCRLCLCKTGTVYDIHSEEEHGFTAAECILDLLQFSVSKTDGYPQLVCLKCLNQLLEFKKFKERCQNAKSRFEMEFNSNENFLRAQKFVEKKAHTDVMLLEDRDYQERCILKQCSDADMKQHPEEKEFSCEYFKAIDVKEEDKPGGQWDSLCLKPLHRDDSKKIPYRNRSTNTCTKLVTTQNDLPFEEENTQESSKQFVKENIVEGTENLAASPRSPSFPSCICIIESDGECSESISNKEKAPSKRKVSKKVKGEKREFNCEDCEKTYNHKSSLTTHMNIHLGLKPFQCDVCKMGFLQSSKLKLHTLRKHAERKFQCSLCPRKFPTENSLAKHSRTHREHRPFQCKLCQCGFYTEKALERHTARHAIEVPFQCNHCAKVFDHKRKILWHIRRSHMIKPHACSICGRRFIKESGLKEHMTLHTGEKNYMCEVCGKAFRRKQCLTIHERVHTGEKPYLCELCNKRFTQRGSLVAHMKMHSR